MPVPAPSLPVAAPAPSPTSIPIEAVANAVPPAILLRAARSVGAAAFHSGDGTVIVLDAPLDFQAAAGLDPVFAGLTSRRTQDATVIRLPAAHGALSLAHGPRGWVITSGPPDGPLGSIAPQLVAEAASPAALRFPLAAPSRAVRITDPETGAPLLVGTQTEAGQAITNTRIQVQFTVLPTLQGIAVAATSDDVMLRREGDGFTLQAGPHAGGAIVAAAPVQSAEAPPLPPLSRLFDIPNDTIHNLDLRLGEQTRAAGNAPASPAPNRGCRSRRRWWRLAWAPRRKRSWTWLPPMTRRCATRLGRSGCAPPRPSLRTGRRKRPPCPTPGSMARTRSRCGAGCFRPPATT